MRTFFAITLITLSFLSYSQDFRKSNWGDSMTEVKEAEGGSWETGKLDDGTVVIGKEVKVGGLDAGVGFYFFQDQLIGAGYFFEEHYTNNKDYIVDFKEIKEILDSKYGSSSIRENWAGSSSPEEYWAHYIRMGDLEIYTEHESDETEIMHTLNSENHRFQHSIFYRSKELKDLINQVRDNVAADF